MRKIGSGSQGGEGVRPWTMAAALLAVWAFAPAAANAQRLWSVGEVTHVPDGPAVVMEGVAVGPGLAGPGGAAPPRVSAEVQVTYDYLRLGFGFLELPLPDGSTIEAENAVFEDRGGGNVMWTGEVPDAGYESVLFTVQDGHLVGWFGEPGGPKYVVKAGPDGRGTLVTEAGPTGDWCDAGSMAHHADLARSGAAPQARGDGSAVDSATKDIVEILVLYPERTARLWRPAGGIQVAIQHHSDYLNVVWRNGQLPAKAKLIAAPYEPAIAQHPSAQGFHFTPGGFYNWFAEFQLERERLAFEHGADMVYFLYSKQVAGFLAGTALVRDDLDVWVPSGWGISTVPAVTAHEVGHMLGGGHEPFTFADFPEVQASRLRPYAFAHTDLSSCEERAGGGSGRRGCPISALSYGDECLANPETYGVTEPYYSSVRHRPNGWTIGVANERENERLFHKTVPVAAIGHTFVATHGWYEWPSAFASWIGRDTARITLLERVPAYFSYYQILFGLDEGPDDTYSFSNYDPGSSSANLKPILVSDGGRKYVVGFDVEGLRPGGSYSVAFAPHSPFLLEPPQPHKGAPEAASGLGARVTGPGSVRLRWRDNSRVETGYEVWYRKWSGDEPDEVWRRYGEPLAAGARSVDVGGLSAEENILVSQGGEVRRGRYSFVVLAYNDNGFSASETLHYEFTPRSQAEPTAVGGITDCVPRDTGLRPDGYEVHVCVETPDGGRRRAWDYRLKGERMGLLYFFERDNVEVLLKVLDGCAINGHRWVFVAPLTTLSFRLEVREPDGSAEWSYDAKRRSQSHLPGVVGNPKGQTARTVSDTTAFPCSTAEIAAAETEAADVGDDAGTLASGGGPLAASAFATAAMRLTAGAATDCVPSGPALTLSGGYTVSMCYETSAGSVGQARDWGLDSSQSALLYFFGRNNVEVLIKVLDGCGVNGHRWVFVAPVTDLAFNLHVESPGGERWIHRNRLGQTADAAGDTSAFPCSA